MDKVRLGARNELKVCIDLMGRGFDVYRCVSNASKCDIIAVKDDICIRVEVRTARVRYKGLTYANPKGRRLDHDIIAVVLGDAITYIARTPRFAEYFPN